MSYDAPLRRTLAVGVVVPVHNEQQLLGAALGSLENAFADMRQGGVSSKVTMVLDACSDASEDIVREWQRELARDDVPLDVTVVTCHAKNVGYARGLGCSTLLAQWSRVNPARIWLATTDADSRVPRDWLATQVIRHNAGADLWSGRVAVSDWSEHRHDTRLRWQRDYEQETQPIHGASLGFNAAAYLAVGGFMALKTGEDRALHRALVAQGSKAHYDSETRVITSARRRARAPLGFAHALDVVKASLRLRTTS